MKIDAKEVFANQLFASLANQNLIPATPGAALAVKSTIDFAINKYAPKRSNTRGEGAHYANEMKAIGPAHRDILEVLDSQGAYGYEKGLTSPEVTYLVNHNRTKSGRKHLRQGTIQGRLSELQGLKIVSCIPAIVTLEDKDTMRFEYFNVPKWYRVSRTLLEVKEETPRTERA